MIGKVRTNSGKPGPKQTPLRDLLLYEGVWYTIFNGLRGPETTLEEGMVLGADLRGYRGELAALRESLAVGTGTERQELDRKRRQHEADIQDSEWALKCGREWAEPEVWRTLVLAFEAGDAAGVRKTCQRSKHWLNPRWSAGPVELLAKKAEQFVRANQDAYYPHRDSRDAKRPIFFARAMSGISCGISPITAVHRLRKLKHGRKCCCVECKANHWTRYYKSLYSALKKRRNK